ncbi:hypothetical protein [Niallia taxi]|uniref:hypothetical protein n=1 Tax=Niallia taxi TaxID=2499688 RepID=UPI0015F58C6C|nr:hypothetical protein [Niallia taxi]
MEMNPELIQLSTQLAKIIGTSSVQVVTDKIKVAKGKKNSDEIINTLEEIISQLISEKNELIQIAQAYDQTLIAQKMTDEEIEYITGSIVPLIDQMLGADENSEKLRQQMDVLKPLLSKETINIMQLLGFNFKRAIGEPLTELVRELINSKKPITPEDNYDLLLVREQKELEYIKLAQNEEAFKNLKELYGRN